MYNNQDINNNLWKGGQLNDLVAGDILLFRPSKKVNFPQKVIMFCQSLIRKKHGHYDTVHAAICTGYDAANQPTIAHVTVVANHQGAYVHEPLQKMLDRDGGDRPFLVYRSKNPALATEMGRVAAELNTIKKFKYSVFGAATSLLYYPKFTAVTCPKQISTSTFCSRFVIQVMQKASKNLSLPFATPNNNVALHGRSTPKALESFLSQDGGYQRWCYAGQNPYADVIQEIQKQIARLKLKTGSEASNKSYLAENAFLENIMFLEGMAYSDWEKAQHLFNAMLPIFKKNTGCNWKTPTSYKSLTGLARKMGIFKKDLEQLQGVNSEWSNVYFRA